MYSLITKDHVPVTLCDRALKILLPRISREWFGSSGLLDWKVILCSSKSLNVIMATSRLGTWKRPPGDVVSAQFVEAVKRQIDEQLRSPPPNQLLAMPQL